ncbi:MAG: DUF2291 family protein [Synergistaceae bacterium]|nr:DUF2291 family protein [Synergistaceae bacterium]
MKIALVAAVALIVFLASSAKVIDVGTEDQHTGVVAFDARTSSGDDWEAIVAEIMADAVDVQSLDLSDLGAGKAVRLRGTVSGYSAKANGKKAVLTVVPDGHVGDGTFVVQVGSIYTGTAVRDVQTVKAFGDFTNQTEWSQYAKALNAQLHELVVAPLALGEDAEGKTISLVGAATASGSEVTIVPVVLSVE